MLWSCVGHVRLIMCWSGMLTGREYSEIWVYWLCEIWEIIFNFELCDFIWRNLWKVWKLLLYSWTLVTIVIPPTHPVTWLRGSVKASSLLHLAKLHTPAKPARKCLALDLGIWLFAHSSSRMEICAVVSSTFETVCLMWDCTLQQWYGTADNWVNLAPLYLSSWCEILFWSFHDFLRLLLMSV